MSQPRSLILFAFAALTAACATSTHRHGCVERLYVIDRGGHHTNDLSRWTPGENVGAPWDFRNHCYLIRHASGWLLWDTGYADAIAAMPDGLVLGGGAVHIRLPETLSAQLAAIGVAPADITRLAFSHFHLDHVGNAALLPTATLYVQATEYAAAFGDAPQRFGFDPDTYASLRHNPVQLLHGDCDVFGDGSAVILSTPGHTPGHQSLLVRLPKSGAVILSGDVAHFAANWQRRRVPAGNFDRQQSLASMERIAAVMAEEHAQLWINHDQAAGAEAARVPTLIE
jgi:glyoxylase-like metal-dependent hydrolase (beta-lactamase superfamily II)